MGDMGKRKRCGRPIKTDIPNQWERLPGESAVVYGHFMAFCNLGAYRNLPKLQKELGLSLSTLRNYSHKFNWYERAAVFDESIYNHEVEVLKKEVVLRKRKYIVTLDDMIAKGAESLDTKDKPNFSEGKSMIVDGIKVAQLLLGEATERIESGQDGNLSNLSEEELWKYRELNKKIFGEDIVIEEEDAEDD